MMAAPGAAQMSEEGRAEAAGDALAKRAKSLTKQANLPQKMKKMARFWLDFEDIPLIIPAAPADLPTDCQGAQVLTVRSYGADIEILTTQSMLALGLAVFELGGIKRRRPCDSASAHC
eukprot:TRINITY_DN8290_c0_g1_i1.p2 TRINITY_DN8290_c0_g1~~TRINITY_DN8290_c0_g1_i1.p2  ORF type:complete len:118 (+),score=30.75 TRINITY_DN8290_c0_g1_i1:45-398(+)